MKQIICSEPVPHNLVSYIVDIKDESCTETSGVRYMYCIDIKFKIKKSFLWWTYYKFIKFDGFYLKPKKKRNLKERYEFSTFAKANKFSN